MNVELDKSRIVIRPETEQRKYPLYVSPGISELTVTEYRDWNDDEKSKSASGIEFSVLTLLDKNTGATHNERFYMGEQSKPYSISKLSHIVSVLCPECNDITKISTTDQIADAIVGKSGRWKINGEMVMSKKDKLYARATNFPKVTIYEGQVRGFVERLDQPSKLKFDENNSYDIKPLKEKEYASPVRENSNVKNDVDPNDGLPF